MSARRERNRNIKECINDVTENLLEKMTAQGELDAIEALRWLSMLEREFVELERTALAMATARGYTLRQCAEALGISRQTLDTKFGNALRPIKQARKEAEKGFKKIIVKPELNDDGKITWKYFACDISELDYTEDMFDADCELRERIKENPENYEAICDRAMGRGVLPPDGIEQIRQQARQYLEYLEGSNKRRPGETDEDYIDRQMSGLFAEQYLNRSAEDEKEALEDAGPDEEQWEEMKLEMTTEDHKYLVAWERFQEEEKAEGRIPTKKALADRMGMNRSTLSRKINREMRRLTYSRTFMEKNEHEPKR